MGGTMCPPWSWYFRKRPGPSRVNVLKLKDQYDYQLASLLWDLDHDTLQVSLSSYFNKISVTHSHETRQAAANKYRVNRANTHYGLSFQIQGSEFLNNLKKYRHLQ